MLIDVRGNLAHGGKEQNINPLCHHITISFISLSVWKAGLVCGQESIDTKTELLSTQALEISPSLKVAEMHTLLAKQLGWPAVDGLDRYTKVDKIMHFPSALSFLLPSSLKLQPVQRIPSLLAGRICLNWQPVDWRVLKILGSTPSSRGRVWRLMIP